MAHCKNCGRDVGCECNLIDGLCTTCLAYATRLLHRFANLFH